jgi:hypothetical protein
MKIDSPEIILFTQSEVLHGTIMISTIEGRLLDELNGRITAVPENRDKFLQISDVLIEYSDGRQEKTPSAYVNKETIQMAATASADTCRGIGSKPGPKPYPFTEKIPVPVRIVMPGYEIDANMYRLSHQKVEHVLIEKTRFIPLTNAEISITSKQKKWSLPFLAVNKDQILSLSEL